MRGAASGSSFGVVFGVDTGEANDAAHEPAHYAHHRLVVSPALHSLAGDDCSGRSAVLKTLVASPCIQASRIPGWLGTAPGPELSSSTLPFFHTHTPQLLLMQRDGD